jgi:hypothetical protein
MKKLMLALVASLIAANGYAAPTRDSYGYITASSIADSIRARATTTEADSLLRNGFTRKATYEMSSGKYLKIETGSGTDALVTAAKGKVYYTLDYMKGTTATFGKAIYTAVMGSDNRFDVMIMNLKDNVVGVAYSTSPTWIFIDNDYLGADKTGLNHECGHMIQWACNNNTTYINTYKTRFEADRLTYNNGAVSAAEWGANCCQRYMNCGKNKGVFKSTYGHSDTTCNLMAALYGNY